MPDFDGWITTSEAEEIAGVGRTSLYIYRLSGKVRSQKFGRAVMYWREDCERVRQEREDKERKERGE